MTADPSALCSRRSVLAAALGGLGALVASRIASPDAARAAAGDPVLVDGTHTGTGTTSISSSVADAPAIYGIGAATGYGVRGASTGGVGVLGSIGNAGTAEPPAEVGVYGWADGSSQAFGIAGEASSGIGVWGASPDVAMFANGTDRGLYAYGKVGVTGDAFTDETGVYGFTGESDAPDPTPGVGVEARAELTTNVALKVIGRAQFSRSGRTYVGANAYYRKVTMAGVTTASYILATLQTKRTGVYVHAVVPYSGYFYIYLNKAVTATTYVGYLVIN